MFALTCDNGLPTWLLRTASTRGRALSSVRVFILREPCPFSHLATAWNARDATVFVMVTRALCLVLFSFSFTFSFFPLLLHLRFFSLSFLFIYFNFVFPPLFSPFPSPLFFLHYIPFLHFPSLLLSIPSIPFTLIPFHFHPLSVFSYLLLPLHTCILFIFLPFSLLLPSLPCSSPPLQIQRTSDKTDTAPSIQLHLSSASLSHTSIAYYFLLFISSSLLSSLLPSYP